LVAVSFFQVAKHFKDPVVVATSSQIPPVSSQMKAFLSYSKAMNEAQEALNAAMHGETTGVDEALKELDAAPHLDQEADDLREQLKALMLRAKSENVLQPSPSTAKKNATNSKAALQQDVLVWKKQYNQWLQSTGRYY